MEDIIGFEALYESMLKCKRGVIWKDSVAHFVLNGTTEILRLEEQLKSGTYKPRIPRPFEVVSAKKRMVMGIPFRDRVYQRSLNDNAIYPQVTKHFIYDNCACQKGKGTDFARKRLHCFLQRFYRKHGLDGYVLQCDIKGYYPNMPHRVADGVFKRFLQPEVYKLAEIVMKSQYDGEIGYYPGSQMIQIAGISVLNDLDHSIKERLRIKHYLRYMDDFLLIHEDKEYLEYCRDQISKELDKIGLWLHPRKTRIYPVSEPIKFLGFYHRLTDTGKIVKLIDPKNVKLYRRKLRRLVNKAKQGRLDRKVIDECYKTWRSHAKKGNSYNLMKRMDDYYKGLWDS